MSSNTTEHGEHFNESIVNEVILEDMKKNRIDHMKYLPGMETMEESDVMEQVIAAMNAYDYDKYTERRSAEHWNMTIGRLRTSRHFFLLRHFHFWKRLLRQREWRQENILETVYICLHQSISQTTVKITASTAVLTATIKFAVHS